MQDDISINNSGVNISRKNFDENEGNEIQKTSDPKFEDYKIEGEEKIINLDEESYSGDDYDRKGKRKAEEKIDEEKSKKKRKVNKSKVEGFYPDENTINN